jgi:hypothetical protein
MTVTVLGLALMAVTLLAEAGLIRASSPAVSMALHEARYGHLTLATVTLQRLHVHPRTSHWTPASV